MDGDELLTREIARRAWPCQPTRDSVSGAPDADPVGASARPVLAIVIFIVSTAWVILLLARLQERGRR
jgi:hypothetical protein